MADDIDLEWLTPEQRERLREALGPSPVDAEETKPAPLPVPQGRPQCKHGRLAADIEKLSGMPIQSRIDVVDGIATYWAGITMPGRGDVIVEGKTANDAIARLHYELHKPVAPEPPAPIAELPTDAESIEVTYDDVSDRDP